MFALISTVFMLVIQVERLALQTYCRSSGAALSLINAAAARVFRAIVGSRTVALGRKFQCTNSWT